MKYVISKMSKWRKRKKTEEMETGAYFRNVIHSKYYSRRIRKKSEKAGKNGNTGKTGIAENTINFRCKIYKMRTF